MRRTQIRILVCRTNDIDSLKLLNQFEIEEARRRITAAQQVERISRSPV